MRRSNNAGVGLAGGEGSHDLYVIGKTRSRSAQDIVPGRGDQSAFRPRRVVLPRWRNPLLRLNLRRYTARKPAER